MRNQCQHFSGEKPCSFHKTELLTCPCPNYAEITQKILIIKLGALGDVLRTTPLLPVLKTQYPGASISWVVNHEGMEILGRNPALDKVYSFDFKNWVQLNPVEFDLLYNLEVDLAASGLAEKMKSQQKFGFGMNEDGRMYPFNDGAAEYLEMSFSDIAKKQNKKTYLQLIKEICELDERVNFSRPYLHLSQVSQVKAEKFAEDSEMLLFKKPVIGLNLGAGKRWGTKAWNPMHFVQLINLLKQEMSCHILLFSGAEEEDLADEVYALTSDKTINAGSKNSLNDFFALVNLCDVVVAADTLAIHVALALGKRVVAMFGPTSYHEIDDFGLLEKVTAPVDCLVCYKNTCDKKPFCMDLISPHTVMEKIEKQLSILKGSAI